MICTPLKIRIAAFLLACGGVSGVGVAAWLPFKISCMTQQEQNPCLSKTCSSPPHPQGGKTSPSLVTPDSAPAVSETDSPMEITATSKNTSANVLRIKRFLLFQPSILK